MKSLDFVSQPACFAKLLLSSTDIPYAVIDVRFVKTSAGYYTAKADAILIEHQMKYESNKPVERLGVKWPRVVVNLRGKDD